MATLAHMANTMVMKRKVEDFVRAVLCEEYGQPFESKFLRLTTGGRHEFDAVSADGQIVTSIKASSGLTSGGRIPSGKIKDSLAELYYLSLVDAPVRILVLTTPAFHELFAHFVKGALPNTIKLRLITLPPDLQREVDVVVAIASREVAPRIRERILPTEIES